MNYHLPRISSPKGALLGSMFFLAVVIALFTGDGGKQRLDSALNITFLWLACASWARYEYTQTKQDLFDTFCLVCVAVIYTLRPLNYEQLSSGLDMLFIGIGALFFRIAYVSEKKRLDVKFYWWPLFLGSPPISLSFLLFQPPIDEQQTQ